MYNKKVIPSFVKTILSDENQGKYIIPKNIISQLENFNGNIIDLLMVKENMFSLIRQNFHFNVFFNDGLPCFGTNSICDNNGKTYLINSLYNFVDKVIDLDYFGYTEDDFRFCNRYKTEVLIRNIWGDEKFIKQLSKTKFDFSIKKLKTIFTIDKFYNLDGSFININRVKSNAGTGLSYYGTFLKENLANKFPELESFRNNDSLFLEKFLDILYGENIKRLTDYSPETLKEIFGSIYSFLDFDGNIITKNTKDTFSSKQYGDINYSYLTLKIVGIKSRTYFSLVDLVKYIYGSEKNFWDEVNDIIDKSIFNFKTIEELKDFFCDGFIYPQKKGKFYVNKKYGIFPKNEFLNKVFEKEYILKKIPEGIIYNEKLGAKSKKKLLGYILFGEHKIDEIKESIDEQTSKKFYTNSIKERLSFSDKDKLKNQIGGIDIFLKENGALKGIMDYPKHIVFSDKIITYSKSDFVEKFLDEYLGKDYVLYDYNSGDYNTKFSEFVVSILFPEEFIKIKEKRTFDKTKISDLKDLFNENLNNLRDENNEYLEIEKIIFESKIFTENTIKGSVLWMNLKMFVKPEGIEKIEGGKDATKWLVEEYLGIKN